MSEFAKSFMKKSPLRHWIGKHPGKDGHIRADHKTRRKEKKEASDDEFKQKYGVDPKYTRRSMSGQLTNVLTGEIINE
jgi:hypothetical protein